MTDVLENAQAVELDWALGEISGLRAEQELVTALRDLMAEYKRVTAPPTDEQVRAAVKAHKAPRLHVNDSQIDREFDMYAALEAARAVR